MFSFTVKPFRKITRDFNSISLPPKSLFYCLLESFFSEELSAYSSLMTTEADNSGSTIQKNTPCLPSSALFPLLASPIQGDAVNQSGVEHCQDSDFKQSSNQFRSLKMSNHVQSGLSSLECLFCGCVSKHIEETLEFPSSLKDQRSRQDKPLVIATAGRSTESLNNNIPPEPPSNYSCDERVSNSSKDEEKRRVLHNRSPFVRLRLFFSKRRRKTESLISDGILLAADTSSKDISDGSRSSFQLENDLKEQVRNRLSLFLFI